MNLAHEKAELVLWVVYLLGLITKANNSSSEGEKLHPNNELLCLTAFLKNHDDHFKSVCVRLCVDLEELDGRHTNKAIIYLLV